MLAAMIRLASYLGVCAINLSVAIICCLTIVGCTTHGQLGTLPKPADPTKAAEVTIVRVSNLYGSGISYRVGIDYQEFIAIRSGEHTKIRVTPGRHLFTVKVPSRNFGTEYVEESLQLDCELGRKIYLVMSPMIAAAALSVVGEEEGEKLVKKTDYVDLR